MSSAKHETVCLAQCLSLSKLLCISYEHGTYAQLISSQLQGARVCNGQGLIYS